MAAEKVQKFLRQFGRRQITTAWPRGQPRYLNEHLVWGKYLYDGFVKEKLIPNSFSDCLSLEGLAADLMRPESRGLVSFR